MVENFSEEEEEEKEQSRQGGVLGGSLGASLDDAQGNLDKQADGRKRSCLSIWMPWANVQKAREEGYMCLAPSSQCGGAALPAHFPPAIPLKLSKPMSQLSTQDSSPSHKQPWGKDTEGDFKSYNRSQDSTKRIRQRGIKQGRECKDYQITKLNNRAGQVKRDTLWAVILHASIQRVQKSSP